MALPKVVFFFLIVLAASGFVYTSPILYADGSSGTLSGGTNTSTVCFNLGSNRSPTVSLGASNATSVGVNVGIHGALTATNVNPLRTLGFFRLLVNPLVGFTSPLGLLNGAIGSSDTSLPKLLLILGPNRTSVTVNGSVTTGEFNNSTNVILREPLPVSTVGIKGTPAKANGTSAGMTGSSDSSMLTESVVLVILGRNGTSAFSNTTTSVGRIGTSSAIAGVLNGSPVPVTGVKNLTSALITAAANATMKAVTGALNNIMSGGTEESTGGGVGTSGSLNVTSSGGTGVSIGSSIGVTGSVNGTSAGLKTKSSSSGGAGGFTRLLGSLIG